MSQARRDTDFVRPRAAGRSPSSEGTIGAPRASSGYGRADWPGAASPAILIVSPAPRCPRFAGPSPWSPRMATPVFPPISAPTRSPRCSSRRFSSHGAPRTTTVPRTRSWDRSRSDLISTRRGLRATPTLLQGFSSTFASGGRRRAEAVRVAFSPTSTSTPTRTIAAGSSPACRIPRWLILPRQRYRRPKSGGDMRRLPSY